MDISIGRRTQEKEVPHRRSPKSLSSLTSLLQWYQSGLFDPRSATLCELASGYISRSVSRPLRTRALPVARRRRRVRAPPDLHRPVVAVSNSRRDHSPRSLVGSPPPSIVLPVLVLASPVLVPRSLSTPANTRPRRRAIADSSFPRRSRRRPSAVPAPSSLAFAAATSLGRTRHHTFSVLQKHASCKRRKVHSHQCARTTTTVCSQHYSSYLYVATGWVPPRRSGKLPPPPSTSTSTSFLDRFLRREGGSKRRHPAQSGVMAGEDAARAASPMAMVGFRRGALLLLLLLFVLLHHQAVAVKPMPRSISSGEDDAHKPILQESIVLEVNSKPGAGWHAAMNTALSNHTVAQFKRLLGVKPLPKDHLLDIPVKRHPESLKLNLPREFDARTAWSQCATIGRILDQGHCGSCWAFGAVESLSDRFCIQFGLNISLSVNDLLSCCGFMCGDGCDGGYPIMAWRYFVQNGVVTDECDPYFDQIGCQHPGCEPLYPTPVCEKKCKVKNQVWQETKHFSVNAYRLNNDQQDIMAELYKNGPVEVAFTVYEDFAHYKSGVYKHITGGVAGGHAVKLIGWGTSEDGEDYWLVANQWNRGWGDDGYFKIVRGKNECGIEEDVVAGLPSTKNLVRSVGDADEDMNADF